jgi:hypothetical protein
MMPQSKMAREQAQLEHLELVRALSREITSAISAIERNNLPGFQAAIAHQEKICHELAARQWSPSAAAGDPVHAAYADLAQINRVYAGVLKRSKRCADLLTALYGSCAGYGKNVPALGDRQPWTCEV